jgi:hypothetical protein
VLLALGVRLQALGLHMVIVGKPDTKIFGLTIGT